MNSLEEYDEEDTQFFDTHDDVSHDVEGFEESGGPSYYSDEWSNWSTYNGTDYSISVIRLGTVEKSDRPMSIHHLEKIEDTMFGAFIGS